jgi:ethanolamine phosphate transferase 2 subunit G
MRNARQLLKVVTATFPDFQSSGVGDNCDAFLGSLNKVACKWREIVLSLPDGKEDEDVEPWLRNTNKACSLYLSRKLANT